MDDVCSRECPVSAGTPESFELIRQISSMRHVHEHTGAALSADGWSGRLFDAVELIEIEGIRIENARMEAVES